MTCIIQCVIEMPWFFDSDVVEAYVNDPDVKFILTDRDPDKWVKSYNSTLGAGALDTYRFPWNVLYPWNKTLGPITAFIRNHYNIVSNHTSPGDPDNAQNLKDHYHS